MTTALALGTLPRVAIAQAVPELQTLRSTSKSWLWAAEDYATAGGFFERARVKVVSNASNRGTNIAALGGSGVDIVLGDPGEAMRARSQGFPVKSFVGTVNKYASNVVIRKPVLERAGVTESSPVPQKIAALKGLRLGTTGPGAAPDALFRWLALQGGMDPNSDLRLVPIQGGGPGMLAGLQQNVIDGFCLSSPTSDLAVQDRDCAYLFNMATNPPPELEQYMYIIASTNEATLRNAGKREALVRYCQGIAAALKAMQSDRPALKAWADKWFEGLPPQIAEVSFEINSKIFFDNPLPRADLFQKNVDFINAVQRTMGAELLPASVTFEAQYDPSLVTEALGRG
ncbi:ABC transporter substrate-binding protein [Elioraea rosea]|uniref:ABC transporter substrate-binding protein n=1 Tax=Elioraea rosea TaxID=2492390 RepID=UPI001315935E|nr:ABC transporter substrate-binding protein [Elioraea rosea]